METGEKLIKAINNHLVNSEAVISSDLDNDLYEITIKLAIDDFCQDDYESSTTCSSEYVKRIEEDASLLAFYVEGVLLKLTGDIGQQLLMSYTKEELRILGDAKS